MKITKKQLKRLIKEEISASRTARASAEQAAGHGSAGFWVQGKQQIKAILTSLLKKDPDMGGPTAKWLRELADEMAPAGPNDGFGE